MCMPYLSRACGAVAVIYQYSLYVRTDSVEATDILLLLSEIYLQQHRIIWDSKTNIPSIAFHTVLMMDLLI